MIDFLIFVGTSFYLLAPFIIGVIHGTAKYKIEFTYGIFFFPTIVLGYYFGKLLVTPIKKKEGPKSGIATN